MINLSQFDKFVKIYGDSPNNFVLLGENSKIPINNNWTNVVLSKTELDSAVISGSNIGVKLDESDLVVDFDLKHYHAGDPKAYVLEFLREFNIKDTLIVRTVSGGFHIYLKKDPSIQIHRYNKDRWGNVIEFKSKGSQVLAPGCVIEGTAYRITRDGDPQIAPLNLIELIQKKKTGEWSDVQVQISTLKDHLSKINATDNKDYDTWLKIGQAAHSASGGSEEGLDAWVEWCRTDPEYDTDAHEAVNRKKWHSFSTEGGITFAYLKKVIKDSGGVIPRDRAVDDFAEVKIVECEIVADDEELCKLELSLERDKHDAIKNTTINARKIVRFFLKRLGIYYDSCDNLIKFKKLPPWSETNMTWNDRHAKALHEYIAAKIYDMPETKFNNAILAAMADDNFQIHPIQEFLNNLKWDGVPRLNTWLHRYTGCDNNEYSTEVSRYIMLAMVKRAFLPGCKVDYMPIFEGTQGTGKSWLCKILGAPWDTDEDPFSIHDPKDRALVLEGKWVIEIPELSSFARKNPNHLKAFITKTHDRIRRAYGREVENLGRGCIFIGTTNDRFYLQDNTGNRRFLPVQTKVIDIKGIKDIRDMLLAEAVVIYKQQGMDLPLVLSESAELEAKRLQETRRVVSAFEEDMVSYISEKMEQGETFISIDAIRRDIGRNHRTRPISHQTIGQFFEQVGWERGRTKAHGKTIRGYQKLR